MLQKTEMWITVNDLCSFELTGHMILSNKKTTKAKFVDEKKKAPLFFNVRERIRIGGFKPLHPDSLFVLSQH